MSFTALGTGLVNGVDTISAAELQDLMDNIAWFRTRPTSRLYKLDSGQTIGTGSTTQLDFNTGTAAHNEWQDPSGGGWVPASGLHLEVGTVEPGVWLCGFTGGFEAHATGYRFANLVRSDGGTDTSMASEYQTGDADRPTRFNMAGQGYFDSTTDQFEVHVEQNSGGNLDIVDGYQPHRVWAMWMGDADTTYDSNYLSTNARPDESTSITTWWNRTASNQYRLQYRPSAQIYQTSDQSITASTWTTLNMGSTDWENDAALVPAGAGQINIQQTGWYLSIAQVAMKQMGGGTDRVQVALAVDGTRFRDARSPENPTASTDTIAVVHAIHFMTAGEVLTAQAWYGSGTESARGSRRTFLTTTMVSSFDNVSTGRQEFHAIPDDLPSYSSYSTTQPPLGYARLISDLNDRLWAQPVVRLENIADPGVMGNGDGWTTIDMDTVPSDPFDLDGKGYTILSSGGFEIPWAGTWLAVGLLQFSATDEDGDSVGDQGYRGARFALNGRGSRHSILGGAMHGSGHGWKRTWVEPFVVNKAGAVINIQGLVGGLTNDVAVPVVRAKLHVVQIGDGVTWTPSPTDSET